MYFYVDEAGHTGPNLFDADQPMLYYGAVSSKVNVDLLAEPHLQKMRSALGVDRLHANELGNGGLLRILPALLRLQRKLDFTFDLYCVSKPDHAIICFFDQVFDAGLNPAMTWTGYWTPLRYLALLKLAHLFDGELAKAAWEARINTNTAAASAQVQAVCKKLISRIHRIPDARSREVLGDVLSWAINNTDKLSYNAKTQAQRLETMPNIIGFQAVMHGIASRIKKSGIKAKSIIVDQQSQFNKAQRTLAEFYASAREIELEVGPGLPKMDLKNMPDVPLIFTSSAKSAGLELVDIHLWVYKRSVEGKPIAEELQTLLWPHRHGRPNEISIAALQNRWAPLFSRSAQELPPEALERARQIIDADEARRRAAVEADRKADAE